MRKSFEGVTFCQVAIGPPSWDDESAHIQLCRKGDRIVERTPFFVIAEDVRSPGYSSGLLFPTV